MVGVESSSNMMFVTNKLQSRCIPWLLNNKIPVHAYDEETYDESQKG